MNIKGLKNRIWKEGGVKKKMRFAFGLNGQTKNNRGPIPKKKCGGRWSDWGGLFSTRMFLFLNWSTRFRVPFLLDGGEKKKGVFFPQKILFLYN